MMDSKYQKGQNHKSGKSKTTIIVSAGVAIILVAVLVIMFGGQKTDINVNDAGDLTIVKSDITETAKFYPYKVDGKNLEILALKASDGSVRTAFNTCQVCNGSPRAYYKQEGSDLVCQNCGNRFSADMVEQQRGGCNPIPIMQENKADDGTNITISKDFIVQNKDLFTDNWKTQ